MLPLWTRVRLVILILRWGGEKPCSFEEKINRILSRAKQDGGEERAVKSESEEENEKSASLVSTFQYSPQY